VVNESTMISGWFSGQPVAKAVTKSADVDRFVIVKFPYGVFQRSTSSRKENTSKQKIRAGF
jgi:hypothetical protein